MKAKDLVRDLLRRKATAQEIQDAISNSSFVKMTFSEYESIINDVFISQDPSIMNLLNSFYSKLVSANPVQFFHLTVEPKRIKIDCRDLIQNYKYIYQYNRYLDCSLLLQTWSPTSAFYPLLVYIETSHPDIPIDYSYWIQRYTETSKALSFLKENGIQLKFKDEESLEKVYQSISVEQRESFLSLLPTYGWYVKEKEKLSNSI